jgi:hypothetical protein
MKREPVTWWSVLVPLAAVALGGCVNLRAPLLKDDSYPADWPDITTAGLECKSLAGQYVNAGVLVLENTRQQSVLLTQLLALTTNASEVSISVNTQRLDKNGDAFSTLVVSPAGEQHSPRELNNCFCVKQTLTCTRINEEYWSIPNFGVGGSQSNVHISSSTDGSLIIKLQKYHADFVLGVPLYRGTDSWARFTAVGR